MPTRLYFPSTGAAAVSPAISASWTVNTASPSRLKPVRTRINSAFANTTATETVATVSNVFHRQYVSDPLDPQTISGTLTGLFRALESSTSANMAGQVIVRVVSNDGATVRGTLYAGDTSTTSGNPTNEYTASISSRIFPGSAASVTLTSVAVQSGDRLVIEIGSRAYNTATTSFTSTIEFGDAAATDQATSGTATQLNPWMQFSQDIYFLGETPIPVTLSDAVTLGSTPSFAATSLTQVTIGPDQDATPQQDLPDQTSGSDTILKVDTQTPNAEAWLQFTIPAGGSISSATLRLNVTNAQTAIDQPPTLATTTATWSESTITWNNKPAYTSTGITTPNVTVQPMTWDIPVTSIIPASGTITIVIVPSGSDGIDFDSKEGTTPPQLILLRAASAPATPVTLSDSVTLLSAPTYGSTNTSTISDGQVVGSTDALTTSATNTRTDSGTAAATDVLATVSSLAPTDTGLVGVVDTASIFTTTFLTITLVDTSTLVGTDVLASSATRTNTDAGTVSASETVLKDIFVNPLTDADIVTSTDALTISAALGFADTGIVTVDETSDILIEEAVSSGSFYVIGSDEVFALGTTSALTDTDTISTSDTFDVSSTLSIQDADTISETSLFTSGAQAGFADSDQITSVEGYVALTSSPVTSSDVGTFGSSESLLPEGSVITTNLVFLDADEVVTVLTDSTHIWSDTGTVSGAETRAIDIFTTFADTDVVTSAEALSTTVEATYDLSDSGVVLASEGITVVPLVSAVTLDDVSTIVVAETFNILGGANLNLADAGVVADDSTVSLTSSQQLQDTTPLGSMSSVDSFTTQTRGDTAILTAIESMQEQSSLSGQDAGTIAANENFTVQLAAAFLWTDAGQILDGESFADTSSMVLSETDRITSQDTRSLYADLTSSDTAPLGSLDVMNFMIDGVLSDSGVIDVTEAFVVSVQREGEWFDDTVLESYEFFTAIAADIILPVPIEHSEPIELIQLPNSPFLRGMPYIGIRFIMRDVATLRMSPTTLKAKKIRNQPFLRKQGRVDVGS